MDNFAFQTTKRIVFGWEKTSMLGEELRRLGSQVITIVTDQGIIGSGICNKVEENLLSAGFQLNRFEEVEADPRYEIAEKAAEHIKSHQSDTVIGLGGGSPLDIAKVASARATNEGSIKSFFGPDQIPYPGLRTVLIPTTAGTGSEVTPIAILSDEQEKLKKGIVSPYLLPDVAFLDPELTVGLPQHVTASTGMDAIIHAIEAYTSKNANAFTDLLAEKALGLLFNNIRTAYANGSSPLARSNMLHGSLLAGMAFANAGVTAVHAFAYPIGAEFHIPHGVANSIMLIPVMKFNLVGNTQKFAKVASLFGENTKGLSEREAAEKTINALETLTSDLNIPRRLSQYNVKEEHVNGLAENVMKVTRLLANNPRELSLQDAVNIYKNTL